MRNNKTKGFTLIELLAVIVILAIIALIATPLILNVINDAKKGSFQAGSYGIIEAAEYGYSRAMLRGITLEDTVYTYEDGEQKSKTGNVEMTYKGSKPNHGTLLINKDGKIAIAFYQDGYCATKSYSESKITMEKKDTKEECIIPEEVPKVVYDTFDYEKGVNKPQLAEGMTPIKWAGTTEVTTTKDDPEWYDYSNKLWANAKTSDGSYWVWIPRYAYKVKSCYHMSKEECEATTGKTYGEIAFVFLEGISKQNDNNIIVETTQYEVGVKDTSTNYFLHPSFNQGGEEILGYWVAKFESSGSIDNIEVKPNVTTLTTVSVSDIFSKTRNMKNNSNYGWVENEVDPHMMTNLEWGAVSYLTYSIYGKNEKVWNNPYLNEGYKTGCAGDTVNDYYISTYCYQYHTNNGQEASTTGNITGIYDMSGGAFEFVAAYVNNNHERLTLFSLNLLNETDLKYKNVYTVAVDDSQVSNYELNKNIYGDAMYETSGRTDSSDGSWNGEHSYMPNTDNPVLRRGGRVGVIASQSGLFHSTRSIGIADSDASFRVTLRIVK